MTQIDPSMGPVEAIATTTLWNTRLARLGGKVGLVPMLKYLVEHGPLYCARVAGHLKEGPHVDDHKQRTDDTEDPRRHHHTVRSCLAIVNYEPLPI